ncbi:MAG: DUF6929 family protein [Panacagrimonas sp.]
MSPSACPDLPDSRLRAMFPLHLSAASSLVRVGDVVHVIADDRLAVFRFRLDGNALPPLALAGIGDAVDPLPKPVKPDLEALLELPDGRLFAFGSGSTTRRESGFLIDLAGGLSQRIDLAPLYASLRSNLGNLNIEGAASRGSHLVLAHRGVGERGGGALILLDVPAAPACGIASASMKRIVPVDLGRLDGVPLAITDLAIHPQGGLYFCAAAEATDDPYLDGSCTGSVMGRFDEDFRPCELRRLRPDVKAEGLCWWKTINGLDHWLLVADADDPAQHSPLFTLTL